MTDTSPSSPNILQSRGRLIATTSLGLLFLGLFGLLGGAEYFLLQEDQSGESSFLIWPISLFYFWPLCIPLGLYLVIARWTGDKHFRHA